MLTALSQSRQGTSETGRELMPKSTRVTCYTCRAQLGVILNDRLTVVGHQVEYGPRGTFTIVCTMCRTPRSWEERKSA